MAKGVIALLGSGETAPGMTKIHRAILAPLQPLRAVNLDTTYGFQENVPQMSKKLEDYYATSLSVAIETLHFTSFEDSSELDRARFKLKVREANYVFAGPGSPTYALAQWSPLDFSEDLLNVLDNGGTLCFSSAAALTIGAFTAPIYEIYKVGAKPHWVPGLDVLGSLGLPCVVIPHFDNNEGGNYDTRFCYLGKRRLRILEDSLADVATLGIDEHTAVIINFDSETLSVHGRGNAYWRQLGVERVLVNGETVPLVELQRQPVLSRVTNPEVSIGDSASAVNQLAALVLKAGPESLDALARLTEIATRSSATHLDPTPLIDGVLGVRRKARQQGHYELADHLRHVLNEFGVDVDDGPEGSTWLFHH